MVRDGATAKRYMYTSVCSRAPTGRRTFYDVNYSRRTLMPNGFVGVDGVTAASPEW